MLKRILVFVLRKLVGLRVIGPDKVPPRGPVLLVSNHVTWIDGLIVLAALDRPVRFIVSRDMLEHPVFGPLIKIVRPLAISPSDTPGKTLRAIKAGRRALEEGNLLCMFAEGALTRNGHMRDFKPGLEMLARDTGATIIPVHIGGGWGRLLSCCPKSQRGRSVGCVRHGMTLAFGQSMPDTSPAWAVRQKVQELSAVCFDVRRSRPRTLPALLIRSLRHRPLARASFDSRTGWLRNIAVLAFSIALARRLRVYAAADDSVGILLPASNAAALANIAVTLMGKTPVNLNFTASRSAISAAIRKCRIQTIVSSSEFLSKMGSLEDLPGLVCMEDLKKQIRPFDGIRAFLEAALLPARFLLTGTQNPDGLATVIFSSGSEGEPKGAALSHHNIVSNMEAFLEVVHFSGRDVLCGILPFFHSFGYTCTLWFPLLCGVRVVYHTNPTEVEKIAGMIADRRVTVLLATPSLLRAFTKRARQDHLDCLRLVIAGAEKLTAGVADAFEARFGIRPLEGYGCTELSPVAAVNIYDTAKGSAGQAGMKEGSVGHPLPGVTANISEPDSKRALPPGGEGLLKVKGPNVMLGYLNEEGVIQRADDDGWYETGDIARLDEEGFLYLVDRASRFSKIGGEMVAHGVVESILADHAQGGVAVSAAQTQEKGEQLVVFHTPEAGKAEELQEWLNKSDLPNLWKPKPANYVEVKALPLLGSGKLDLTLLRSMARDALSGRRDRCE